VKSDFLSIKRTDHRLPGRKRILAGGDGVSIHPDLCDMTDSSEGNAYGGGAVQMKAATVPSNAPVPPQIREGFLYLGDFRLAGKGAGKPARRGATVALRQELPGAV
jgi:hypothetical protein